MQQPSMTQAARAKINVARAKRALKIRGAVVPGQLMDAFEETKGGTGFRNKMPTDHKKKVAVLGLI